MDRRALPGLAVGIAGGAMGIVAAVTGDALLGLAAGFASLGAGTATVMLAQNLRRAERLAVVPGPSVAASAPSSLAFATTVGEAIVAATRAAPDPAPVPTPMAAPRQALIVPGAPTHLGATGATFARDVRSRASAANGTGAEGRDDRPVTADGKDRAGVDNSAGEGRIGSERTDLETTSVETTKVETTDVETTKVETTSVETTGVETTSVEATDVETTSVETTGVGVEADQILAPRGPESVFDSETGLLDERVFVVSFERKIAAARRHLRPLCLVLIDVGTGLPPHASERNQALKRFGAVVRETLRDADIACRLSATAFGLILEDTPEAGGVWAAERLQIALACQRGGPKRMVAAVAAYPNHGLAAQEVLQRAQDALIRARSSTDDGMGPVEVASGDLT